MYPVDRKRFHFSIFIFFISAAHCFYDDGLEKALNNTWEYEVVVGKYTRDYNKTDNFLQKRHKVNMYYCSRLIVNSPV